MLDLDETLDTSGVDMDGISDDDDSLMSRREPDPKEPRQQVRQGKRDISRFLFVDIETVPDWERLDLFGLQVPGKPRLRTPADKCPEIEDVLDQAIEQIKYDLKFHLPDDDWLAKLVAAESATKKPRVGVREAVKSLLTEVAGEISAEGDFVKKLSVSPHYCKIAALGMASGEAEAVGLIGDEREMLDEFWSMAAVCNPIVGFNSNSFDLPTILVRSMLLGIEPTRKLDLSPWSDSCLDLMVKLFGRGPAIGMKKVAKMFGISPRVEDCDGSKVNELMQTDPEKVRDYVVSDVELTRDLFRKVEGYFV